jgi:death-on-curing protein
MTNIKFVDYDDVIALHVCAMDRYGGAGGIRDGALLRSAVSRPVNVHNYDEFADIYDLTAVLTAGIIQNHPFNDGNKRTGLLAGLLFLEYNGKTIGKLQTAEWYTVIVGLAIHKITERQFAGWLRKIFKSTPDSE